jgi:hypothetical protein
VEGNAKGMIFLEFWQNMRGDLTGWFLASILNHKEIKVKMAN